MLKLGIPNPRQGAGHCDAVGGLLVFDQKCTNSGIRWPWLALSALVSEKTPESAQFLFTSQSDGRSPPPGGA